MIGMQDHFVIALALSYCYLHCSDHHLLVLTMVHRPVHHTLVEQIQYDAQIQLALAGFDLGDVGNPF